MIISFIQTKGGTGKTTLAKCLAYSKAFTKVFSTIGLVELDPQRTIELWQEERGESGLKSNKVHFAQLAFLSHEEIKKHLIDLVQSHEALILDVPGESVGKFATKLAITLSDLVFMPMRSSTNDEKSFSVNGIVFFKKDIVLSLSHCNAWLLADTYVLFKKNDAKCFSSY